MTFYNWLFFTLGNALPFIHAMAYITTSILLLCVCVCARAHVTEEVLLFMLSNKVTQNVPKLLLCISWCCKDILNTKKWKDIISNKGSHTVNNFSFIKNSISFLLWDVKKFCWLVFETFPTKGGAQQGAFSLTLKQVARETPWLFTKLPGFPGLVYKCWTRWFIYSSI